MSESPWAATYVRWQDEAVCKNSGFDMVPDVELPAVREYVTETWCSICPVRADCLLYAMLHREEGYWGGTDTKQRRRLSAKKDRAKCPVCASVSLVLMSVYELCLACGLSWTRASKPPTHPVPPRVIVTDGRGNVVLAEGYL